MIDLPKKARMSLSIWEGERMAMITCEAIKTEDWALTACTLQEWALKLWDFDLPYRHAGRALALCRNNDLQRESAASCHSRRRFLIPYA
jgi:hypothetical protein